EAGGSEGVVALVERLPGAGQKEGGGLLGGPLRGQRRRQPQEEEVRQPAVTRGGTSGSLRAGCPGSAVAGNAALDGTPRGGGGAGGSGGRPSALRHMIVSRGDRPRQTKSGARQVTAQRGNAVNDLPSLRNQLASLKDRFTAPGARTRFGEEITDLRDLEIGH